MAKIYKKIDETTFEVSEEKVISDTMRYTREQVNEMIANAKAQLNELTQLKAEADKLEWS